MLLASPVMRSGLKSNGDKCSIPFSRAQGAGQPGARL